MKRHEAMKLVKYLSRMVEKGYTIVTWNGFDFDILAEESGMFAECRQLAFDHVDMMFHLLCQRGFGVSLACASRAMGLPAKEAGISGIVIPRLWAEGQRGKVLEYVAHDAWVTLQLAIMCEKSGCLCWATRTGRRNEMPLRRGWLSVRDALRLLKPRSAGGMGVGREQVGRLGCKGLAVPTLGAERDPCQLFDGYERTAKRLHGHRARRWVVERFNSWMNRYRRILIRWEKKAVNYQAFLHLAIAYITWNQIKVLG
jgi:hypothetical protein